MEQVWTWLNTLLAGIPYFFANPFTYILVLFIYLQWKRQVTIESKLFSAKLNNVYRGLGLSLTNGIIGGLIASILFIGLGVQLSFDAFLYLWIFAIILMLFHVRFLCFAYSGAIVGALTLLFNTFPEWFQAEWFTPIYDSFVTIHIPALFATVAILHLVEAILIWMSGDRFKTPLFIKSKRGRLVGAYHVQYFWLVPIIFLVEGESALAPLFEGWPLFSTGALQAFSLLLLPAVLGFSETVMADDPRQKLRFSAKWIGLYSVILLAFSFAAEWLHPLWAIVTILFSFAAHEAVLFYSQWREHNRPPRYVHPHNGLMILAVIPNSPAQRMGVKPGEVITKVNEVPVQKRQELYEVMRHRQTYVKLELLNTDGEMKFAKGSIYHEDHHQLGIILAPDEDVPYYLEQKQFNLRELLVSRVRKYTQSGQSETQQKNTQF